MDRTDNTTTEQTTEEKYRAILDEQAKEGLTRTEAAARVGVKPSTLTWWRWELARRDREGCHGRRKTDCPELLPVRVRDVAPADYVITTITTTPYEVVLASGRVVRVPRDFDGATVQSLVRALEELPC